MLKGKQGAELMHETFMQRTIEIARNSAGHPGCGPFAAVIVKDGRIIGEGYNQVTGLHDPTAHAEIVAIRSACHTLQAFSLAGCHLYSSCEPCPMCLGAIMWARIESVYFAADRHLAAKHGFDDAVFYKEIHKPFDQRSIKMVHMETAAGEQPFNIWENNLEKTHY